MKTTLKGKKLIQYFEGFKTNSYLCTGNVWTIGWGSTKVNGIPVKKGDKITLEQADKEFRDYITINIDPILNKLVKVPINQDQYNALASFLYNLGQGSLSRSTLLKKVNANDFAGAAAEFGKWVISGGKITPGLVRRRRSEKTLFETGVLNYYES